MKKFTMFMAFLLLISWQGMAQISSYYTFSESTATYTPLTGGTVTTTITGNSDDGEEPNVPIGFTFSYAGTNYTTLTIGVNGAISFTNPDVTFTNNLSGTAANNTNIIAPLWDDLNHRTVDASEISYLTSGVSPSRTFTIQWKNITWYNAGATVNFQLVLHEGSNNVQFNYGINNSTASRSASIGFNKGTSGTDFISVTPGTPATSSFTVSNNNISTTNYPGNGKVYLFTYSAPACPDPSILTATNITATSADLGWTEMGTATTWDIEWGIAGFTPTGTPNIVGTTTNPHNLTGLTANTAYDFYVRADCGGSGTSNWSGLHTFTTACAAFAVPFSENFSSTSPTKSCWTVIDNNNDGDFWDMNYTSNPLSGDQVAVMYTDFNSGANDDYLVTPTITLTGNERLRFHYRVQSSGEPNDFQVTLSTTGVGVGNFTNVLMPLTAVSNTTYQESIINLSAYTGNVNIAFHVPAGGLDGWRLYIDSVVVEANPACPTPSALTATNITATSADLGWTEMGTATTWDIEWGIAGFTPTGTPNIVGTTTNPHNLTGLTANTAYDFYVRADCGGSGTSNWSGSYYFYTGYCTPSSTSSSTYVDNFTTIGGSVNISNLATGYTTGGYLDATATHYVESYPSATFDFNAEIVGGTAGFSIWIDWNNDLVFDNLTEKVFNTTSYGSGPFIGTITVPSGATLGDYTMRITTDWNASNPSDPCSPAGTRAEFEDYKITLVAPPSCMPPSALTATNITATTADLAWTEMGTATVWDIEWGIAGFTPTGTPNIVGTTTNPHNLTGLTAQTSYDFYVRADCGGSGTSSWSGLHTFTTGCASQLAGTYTIGTAGNYATFTDAVNALSCGISAPVIFNVLAGSGPFNEQITITPVIGASATNTITFNGNGETITFSTSTSPNNYIIRLDGADYITFDNLNVVSQASTNNFAFHLINDADFNTINNCTIDLSSTFSSTGTTNGGIVVSGSLTSATTAGTSGTDNTFTNNTIIGGYYGITINGASSTVNSLNNTITNNDFQNFYTYGLYLRSISNSTISNNEISRMTRSPLGSFYGIYFVTSGENNLIEANEIHDAFTGVGGISTSLAYPIFHSSTDATVGNANKVVNNLIYNINTNGIIYGIYNSGSDGVHYYHNTISLDDAASTGGTTRGFYQTTTASDIEFKNNIITVTKGGTGTKHCIYFNATASTITSNNNVFYINAPAGTNNLGYFSATNQATLLDWQTASSQDASSSDADPIYVNPSNDLTPSNAAIDGIADATVGVANDFYGIARAVTPDPGAIEFMPPTCIQPSALTVTNITATSADLGWTENGTATTWDIEWGTAGFTPTGTPNIVGTTTNPHNLTGLTAQTSYDFYVRADCGGSGTSNWSSSHTFTTPCNTVATFPFLEDFETTSTTRDCWTQIEELGTANWTYNTGSSGGTITTAYSGTQNARFVSQSGTNSPVVKLVSPILDLSGVNTPELAFFYGQENWFSDQNELKVYYRTSTAGAWIQIAHYTASVAVWTADTLTLPNPSATYQIAFEGINNWGRANVVDDVEVYDAITCSDPSNLTAFNIQPTSAMLDWTENGTATNWNVEWGVTGFTLGAGNPQAVAAKPYLLQGLTPGTTYDYYVQADCGLGDTSNWVGKFTFSTPPCVPIVIDLGVDTIVCSKDSILLDAGAGNYSYSWSTGGTAQTELIDTLLMGGNGTYNISVTVTDNISGCIYTDDINITFQLCTNVDELESKNVLAIYPNPTNGILNVMINGASINTALTIVDVQGKVVYAKNNFTNSASSLETIDLSGNDKGIYFITVTTDNETVVKKIILH